MAEVIIEANDGTHGELVFLPGSDVYVLPKYVLAKSCCCLQ